MIKLRLLALPLILVVSTLYAQDSLERSQRALQIIADFSKQMCADPEYRGSASSIAAAAKAKAEVSKLVKNLADANVELSADAKRETFQGMLRTDLLQATRDASNCRMAIFNDLKDRLLPGKAAVNKTASPTPVSPNKADKSSTSKDVQTPPTKPPKTNIPQATPQSSTPAVEPLNQATLQETEAWLLANVTRLKTISCNRILEEGDWKNSWTVNTWSPREVTYEINVNDILLVKCVSGLCVSSHECEAVSVIDSDDGTRAKVYRACGAIDSPGSTKWHSEPDRGSVIHSEGGRDFLPRALMALLHHQKLCGGRVRTPF